jgi:hypothetical protein
VERDIVIRVEEMAGQALMIMTCKEMSLKLVQVVQGEGVTRAAHVEGREGEGVQLVAEQGK